MEYQNTDHTFAVCAYKESPYLESCIKSLMSQTVKSNIIVCTSTPCEFIENMAKKKQTPQRIAEATGVHVATIYREMKRGQTKDGYSAIKAQCEVLR